MTTTTRHAAPWTLRRIMAELFQKPAPRRLPAVMTGREATAQHLFGEAVNWSRLDLLEYENSPILRGAWLAEADRRIAAAKSPDRFVAAHHRMTVAEWDQQPALVKKDLREDFYAARGLAS